MAALEGPGSGSLRVPAQRSCSLHSPTPHPHAPLTHRQKRVRWPADRQHVPPRCEEQEGRGMCNVNAFPLVSCQQMTSAGGNGVLWWGGECLGWRSQGEAFLDVLRGWAGPCHLYPAKHMHMSGSRISVHEKKQVAPSQPGQRTPGEIRLDLRRERKSRGCLEGTTQPHPELSFRLPLSTPQEQGADTF